MGIEVDGAVIPITAENANRIRAAVQTLRARLQRAEEATPAPAIGMLVARMDAWYEEVSRMADRPLLDAGDKTALQGLVQYSLDKLRRLAASPGLCTLAHYRTVTVPVAIIFAAASGDNFQFLSNRPSATTEASEPLKKM